jgi:hypothetical protein
MALYRGVNVGGWERFGFPRMPGPRLWLLNLTFVIDRQSERGVRRDGLA